MMIVKRTQPGGTGCCGALQCVAVCCNVLPVLYCVAECRSAMVVVELGSFTRHRGRGAFPPSSFPKNPKKNGDTATTETQRISGSFFIFLFLFPLPLLLFSLSFLLFSFLLYCFLGRGDFGRPATLWQSDARDD